MVGFIKRITILCYTQNNKALSLVALEKKNFLCFSHDAPRGGACMDLRDAVGRIYKEDLYTLLHTKYECSFREEDFFPTVSPMGANDPGAGPFLTPRAWLAGFTKRTTIHCYIQSMKALGLVVSEKKIFFNLFPMTPPGRSLYGPQGHGWQDL